MSEKNPQNAQRFLLFFLPLFYEKLYIFITMKRYALAITLLCLSGAEAFEPCRIRVVDSENGWPVPLVELRTTHDMRFVSDNAGNIAIDHPELMDREVWFHVEGHGYSVGKDGFGYRGVRLVPQSGRVLSVKVDRSLPGKRLGRITGAGLFAESRKLGLHTDWKEQGIFGCDTVQLTPYNGHLFWLWGDTTLAKYPLGIFHTLGATTPLKPLEQFTPPVFLRYAYYTNEKGEPRAIAKLPGNGPTWLGGLIALPDAEGQEHLVATYEKIESFVTCYEKGLCEWNSETANFEVRQVLWRKSEESPEHKGILPAGHPVLWKDNGGKEWVLFGDPFPRMRCAANYESWKDPATWQKLEEQKEVKPAKEGKAVKTHRGSIAWSGFKNKWVAIFTQHGGDSSFLGEIWYAEADQPTGPWANAVKVVTHNNYTFYNPRIHKDFTDDNSPILLFEGTYTREFSKSKEITPRYNYNQILYRIDLDEEAFKFE